MRRTSAVALVPLVALAAAVTAPSTAPAKEIGRVRACGADGCRVVTQRVPDESIFDTGALGAGPPAAHPFVVVRIEIRGGDGTLESGWRFAFVPALGMVRYEAEPGVFHWGTLTPERTRAMRRVVRGVRPWPASRFPRDRRAADGAGAATSTPARVATAAVADRGDDEAPRSARVAAAGAAVAVVAAATVAGLRRRRWTG